MLRRTFRALLCTVLAAGLVAPASATWSIVVVNRRTGEVGIAGATCIDNIYLIAQLPVALPGLGGGVIQAAGSYLDLIPMAEGLRERLSPADILAIVQGVEPNVGTLQSGIVSLYPGAPVTFSGVGTQVARGGLAGEVGDLAYAVQGNVLTGFRVVQDAQLALVNTNGDLGQRLMAAMEAARALGGDGRCSCPVGPRPNSCGCPPANFRKSAHGAFVLVARMGDEEPPCLIGADCQLPSFHLSLNARGHRPDPDPVLMLQGLYDGWRAERSGRPDGVRSRVDPLPALPADGLTKREVLVHLADIDGVPLTHGGASVRVEAAGGERLNAIVGSVTDLGDGRYRFTVTATTRVGLDRLAIRVEDDLVRATLFPYLEVKSAAPTPLFLGVTGLSATNGGAAPFVLHRPELAGGAYLLLGSASGTVPGTPVGGGVRLPLVRDAWFRATARLAGHAELLPGSRGVLDDTGRAEAALRAPPGALLPLIGQQLSWAALITDGGQRFVTDAVSFEVLP